METILVPVDFSETAQNGALYAVGLAQEIHARRIILFNAYSMPLATEMSWAVLQADELKEISEGGLEQFRQQLQAQLGEGGPELVCRSAFGFLADTIEEVAREENAGLVVMGITGGGKLEEALIGSNTTHVVHNTHLPVIIVPPQARWKPVQTIGWACDYKDVVKTTPAETIKDLVALFSARLVVVHNNPEPARFDADVVNGNAQVAGMFKSLRPEFVVVSNDHFAEAMNGFTTDYNIDLLLAIPKRLSWLDSLFHRSHTKMLAFHSHVPLLCVPGL